MIGRYDRGVTRRVRLVSDAIAERDEVIAEKIYARGVHPPDKICDRCKSECGPRIDPGHDTLCDACAAEPLRYGEPARPGYGTHFAVPPKLKPMQRKAVQEMVETPGFAYMDEAPGVDLIEGHFIHRHFIDEKKIPMLLDAQGTEVTVEWTPDVDLNDALKRVFQDKAHAIDCDMDEDCTCKPDEP